VREAIDTLLGGGPTDFREHCLVVAAEMLALSGIVNDREAGVNMAENTLASGAAWDKFRQLIQAQGGDVAYIDAPEHLPTAQIIEAVPAPQSGYLSHMRADEIGMAVVDLGGGREKKGDPIDYAVGVMMHTKVGDAIEAGQPLFTIHANDEAQCAAVITRILDALTLSETTVDPLPLFYERIV
jgi:pyrimidine-nucleoside phosphorylase